MTVFLLKMRFTCFSTFVFKYGSISQRISKYHNIIVLNSVMKVNQSFKSPAKTPFLVVIGSVLYLQLLLPFLYIFYMYKLN